jgi:hypothetical protein
MGRSQAHDPLTGGRGLAITGPDLGDSGHPNQEDTMSKTGRKRRARKKKSANHGKRPNA